MNTDDEEERNRQLFRSLFNKTTHQEKRIDLQDESIKTIIKRLDLIYEALDCDRILLNLKLKQFKDQINEQYFENKLKCLD